MYFSETANFWYQILIKIFKHQNLNQNQLLAPTFFSLIRVRYVDFHIDDVMTESEMSCKFDRKVL